MPSVSSSLPMNTLRQRWLMHAAMAAFSLLAALQASKANAGEVQVIRSGDEKHQHASELCTTHFAYAERMHAIPMHLMHAIAVTESGRAHKETGERLPWPWTINVEGKGRYFETKQEAVATVRQLQKDGAKSIDVGCMQVSLLYHGKAFPTLEDAFDPQKNVVYAAEFLKSQHTALGGWREAIGAYHSRTYTQGVPYANRVMGEWREAMAEASKRAAASTIASAAQVFHSAPASDLVAQEQEGKQLEQAVAEPLPSDGLPPRYEGPGVWQRGGVVDKYMRVRQKRESDVIVVRPQMEATATAEAATSEQAPLVAQPVSAKVIRVEGDGDQGAGPKVIAPSDQKAPVRAKVIPAKVNGSDTGAQAQQPAQPVAAAAEPEVVISEAQLNTGAVIGPKGAARASDKVSYAELMQLKANAPAHWEGARRPQNSFQPTSMDSSGANEYGDTGVPNPYMPQYQPAAAQPKMIFDTY